MAERIIDAVLIALAVAAIPYAWFLFFRYPRMSEFRDLNDAAERMNRLTQFMEQRKTHREERREIVAISEGMRTFSNGHPPNGHAGV